MDFFGVPTDRGDKFRQFVQTRPVTNHPGRCFVAFWVAKFKIRDSLTGTVPTTGAIDAFQTVLVQFIFVFPGRARNHVDHPVPRDGIVAVIPVFTLQTFRHSWFVRVPPRRANFWKTSACDPYKIPQVRLLRFTAALDAGGRAIGTGGADAQPVLSLRGVTARFAKIPRRAQTGPHCFASVGRQHKRGSFTDLFQTIQAVVTFSRVHSATARGHNGRAVFAGGVEPRIQFQPQQIRRRHQDVLWAFLVIFIAFQIARTPLTNVNVGPVGATKPGLARTALQGGALFVADKTRTAFVGAIGTGGFAQGTAMDIFVVGHIGIFHHGFHKIAIGTDDTTATVRRALVAFRAGGARGQPPRRTERSRGTGTVNVVAHPTGIVPQPCFDGTPQPTQHVAIPSGTAFQQVVRRHVLFVFGQ